MLPTVLLLLQTAETALSPTPLQQAADVAVIVLALFGVVGVVFLLFLFKQLLELGRSVRGLLGDVERKVDPIVERSKSVAANVEFVSATIRTDVERVNASVRSITDRLNQASTQMEERIDEFNALLEVVQGEAEGMFIETASTVRGVRAGARRLTAPPAGDAERTPDAPED